MDAKIRESFERLVCELSPENLCCDGELSKTQVRAKLAGIRREWKALEKLAGRKVAQDEIEAVLYARLQQSWK
jgi:hypothetical protein